MQPASNQNAAGRRPTPNAKRAAMASKARPCLQIQRTASDAAGTRLHKA